MEQQLIPSYRENPSLGRRTVTTVKGDTEYRVNCKKIKGEYHVINRDCFEVEGLWYRLASGLIDFDHEKKSWFLKRTMPVGMVHGVVGFDDKGKAVMGNFSPNPLNNVRVVFAGGPVNESEWALNAEILEKANYREGLSYGMYFPANYMPSGKFTEIANLLDHTHKGYNIEDNGQEFAAKKLYYEKYDTPLSEGARRFGRMLGETTFGKEIECTKGYLVDNLQFRNGIVVCRDGSLADENGRPGPEFVTVPLKGPKGLQTVHNIGVELSKRTVIDLKCSLHTHLGNLPKTRSYLVALFRLGFKIQNELFLMFPYYKANPEGIKHKNYNQKLPTLNIGMLPPDADSRAFNEYVERAYLRIFQWLGDGAHPEGCYDGKVYVHPQQQKWNRAKRYYWLNLMNMIFSERGTAEFRLHTPTTNSHKMVAWLFICNAVVRYAAQYEKQIFQRKGTIPLEEVLGYYANNYGDEGRFLSEYLTAYVEERKEAFFKDYEKGDKVSKWEMDGDKKYTFTYKGVRSLV